MKSSRVIFTALLITLIALAGCNIYKFTGPSDNQDTLIEEGKQLLRDGDYEGAFNKFDKALRNDPYNSELRYLHAKAAMRRTGANAITLATSLTALDPSSTGQSVLPFMDEPSPDPWSNERANALYQGVQIVAVDLGFIIDGSATGEIEPDDVLLDMGVVLAVKGILLFRDTNQDMVIDDNDFNLFVFFQNGELNLEGLYELFFRMDSLGNDTTNSTASSPGATAINNLIDNLGELLQQGGEVIEQFIRSLTEGDEDSGVDEDVLNDIIDSIREGSGYYYVDDDIDNDGDGRIDEEYLNGDDDDRDGRFDEDSNGLRGP